MPLAFALLKLAQPSDSVARLLALLSSCLRPLQQHLRGPLALLACTCAPTAYGVECQQWSGDTSALEGKVIGTVSIDARDIFNTARPEESHWIHRLANDLHYQSRRETVGKLLLFAEGERYSQRVLDESERLLRAQNFLASADIRVLQVCGERVWVRVRTTDTWSTIPEVSISRVAGETQRKIALEENNLLGLGQELAFSVEDDIDRSSRTLRYKHRDWNGKRRLLDLELQNNEDGERYQLSVAKPFFSLSDTRSWSVGGHFDRRASDLYADGEVVESMGMEQRYLDISQSWSKGLQNGKLDRWTAGLRIDERQFYRVEDTVAEHPYDSRRQRYPYIRLQHIDEDFVEARHIHQLTGIEDINLGRQYSIEAGYSTRAWGASRDALMLRMDYKRGLRWLGDSLLLGDAWLRAQIASGDSRHQRIGVRGQLHKRIGAKDQFFVEVEVETGHELAPEEQLALGGDSGLRGYEFKQQTGNRTARLTTELRHYPDWHPWRLLRFGAALFVDYGSAWTAGGEPREWLWDVGVGLRLGSSRSSSGRVLHLDFAAPEGRGEPQWTATAKLHF